jgi:ubiquinone/menaquinone biosynthesis C-methylase UbiE
MATAEEIREVNTRYHDLAALDYDAKWSVSFDSAGREQVIGKLERALGSLPPAPWGRSLEVGAGTGYISLNLAMAGTVDRVTASDISPGMIDALRGTADRLGVEVETACCEAADLPFPDASFDLIVGHAVLHHLPDLAAAFAEFRRVLRPGGTLAFFGEPSSVGHRLAAAPKRAAVAVAPLWRRALGVPARAPAVGAAAAEEDALEPFVDIHAFAPGDLVRLAKDAGFADVRISGEELVANWFGWLNRTLEATAAPGVLPRAWYLWAWRGYLELQRLDRRLLEPRLPPTLFYSLLLSARAPEVVSLAGRAHRPAASSARR